MDPIPTESMPVEDPSPVEAPAPATDAPVEVPLDIAGLQERTSAHMDPMAKEASREQVEALLRASESINRPMGTASTTASGARNYPSLYDSTGTTIVAIVLGIVIVGGIQYAIQQIYMKSKNEHELLTRFVVSLVALVVGAYITDLLIAGPDTSLLSDDEHTIILGFIKDICLMVFAFYFGTKASSSSSSPPSNPSDS
jgi:hypothetical protein